MLCSTKFITHHTHFTLSSPSPFLELFFSISITFSISPFVLLSITLCFSVLLPVYVTHSLSSFSSFPPFLQLTSLHVHLSISYLHLSRYVSFHLSHLVSHSLSSLIYCQVLCRLLKQKRFEALNALPQIPKEPVFQPVNC